MDWKFLFLSYQGRIGVKRFWIGRLAVTTVALIVTVAIEVLGVNNAHIAHTIALLLVLYPSLAVDVKRLHDRGKSGWWLLLLLVPILGFIWWMVELGCLKGQVGANRFDAHPSEDAPI